jgi:TolB-like protein
LSLAAAAAPLNVAVLYFDNDTGAAQYDALKKGMADMLVTDLAAVTGVQVVERDRLEAILAEQKLQRSKAFDPTTAVKLGKLLGAQYAVSGAFLKVEGTLRLDVRLVDIATGKVLATTQVAGAATQLFELEQQLVQKLLERIDAKLKPAQPVSGAKSVSELASFGAALDLADSGRLDEAQRAMGALVRDSPDFALAKKRYAELIKRLREAQKRHGSQLQGVEATLQQHIDAWRARKLSELSSDEDVMHYFGYLHAHCNLQLVRMKRLLGAKGKSEEVLWAPPSKRAELEQYERAWLEGAERLIADNREYRRRGRARNKRAELIDADKELGEQLSQKNLAPWDFSSASSLAIDTGEMVWLGRSPWRSDVDRFSVRPAPVQRNPALKAKAEALFAAAVKELPLDSDPDEVVQKMAELQDVRAEGFVLDAKKEDAVAQWQLFLDRYPKAEQFGVLSKKVEQLLLISDDVEALQKRLEACDATLGDKSFELARRLGRADGAAGLQRFADRATECGRKQKASRAFWEAEAYGTPARAALELGDCPAFVALREKAVHSGQPLSVTGPSCDEP